MSRLLPLFPLQMVAFPGSAIPLHVFEERYREMLGEAEANGTEFGIVLGESGGIVNVGCAMTVEAVVERYEDGRFDVITRGQRRFMLLDIDEELDYVRGRVEFFDDLDWAPVPADLRDRAMLAWDRIDAVQEPARDTPDPTVARLSFEIAQRVDDFDFQNAMLRMRSEIERLNHFIGFVDGHVERLEYKAKMKRVTPLNGSGHLPGSGQKPVGM